MKRKMRAPEKIVYGFLIIFLTLCLTTGYQDTMNLLLLSVVCTAGVGGAFWIGLSFLVGSVVIAVYEKFTHTEGKEILNTVRLGDQYMSTLVSYITQARGQGLSDGIIKVNLSNAGWNPDNIEQAFKSSKLA